MHPNIIWNLKNYSQNYITCVKRILTREVSKSTSRKQNEYIQHTVLLSWKVNTAQVWTLGVLLISLVFIVSPLWFSQSSYQASWPFGWWVVFLVHILWLFVFDFPALTSCRFFHAQFKVICPDSSFNYTRIYTVYYYPYSDCKCCSQTAIKVVSSSF